MKKIVISFLCIINIFNIFAMQLPNDNDSSEFQQISKFFINNLLKNFKLAIKKNAKKQLRNKKFNNFKVKGKVFAEELVFEQFTLK